MRHNGTELDEQFRDQHVYTYDQRKIWQPQNSPVLSIPTTTLDSVTTVVRQSMNRVRYIRSNGFT